MFFVLGCVLLGIVAVFIVARRVAPQSELMNSFSRANSFRNVITSLVVLAGLLFIVQFFVAQREEWREDAIIQIEDSDGKINLFQGEEHKAAIAFDEIPQSKVEYQTSLLLWRQYNDLSIILSEKGYEEQGEKIDVDEAKTSSFNDETHTVPVSLLFERAGTWKITVENAGETVGDIVVEVE
ncbi:hypothetical protein [Bacillus sp. KH172YL63]|uniref:hypothetical protein n=1 Tax=Bacillus sp. KH172YL63 TaxID=2709784 RepID=UPI0013E46ECE|nr:hypothetical protein [Bacillus sp. KH172YL63]BCB03569.1 hypothetical protein KH172YL63_17020 [Bacillus sp. KH172YL63]